MFSMMDENDNKTNEKILHFILFIKENIIINLLKNRNIFDIQIK